MSDSDDRGKQRKRIDYSDRWTLRARDVADLTGLSESEIRKALYAGELPAKRYRGRVWLIKPEDAKAWLDKMCKET